MSNEAANKELFRPEKNSNIYFNACVGNNGFVDMGSYINGFQSSTIILLEVLLNNVKKDIDDEHFIWCQDTAIYPILFSARHFLELFLKDQISKISGFKKNKDAVDSIKANLIKTHNTQQLLLIFCKEVEFVSDDRLSPFLKDISLFISAFHKIDPTGETFRYPYNKQDKLHLTKNGVIGLKSFYEDFVCFSSKASEFMYLTDYLVQEYCLGTYTKHLSRQKIQNIALSLPKKEVWCNQTLKSHQEVVKKLGVGSREFKRVLKIIENHPEFGNIVSDGFNLDIDEDKLLISILNGILDDYLELDLSLNDLAFIRAVQDIGEVDSSDRLNILKMHFLKENKDFDKDQIERETDHICRKWCRTIKGLEKLRLFKTLNKLKSLLLIILLNLIKAHKDCPIQINHR